MDHPRPFLAAQHRIEPLYGNPARGLANSENIRVLAFLGLHMPLALLLDRFSLLSTAHALFIFALGLYLIVRDSDPKRLLYVIAYIAAAELLWRGTGASVFWEFGKYAIVLLLLLSIFKQQLFFSSAKLPFLYFLCLLPSILVVPAFNREDISFNLSGPLALAIATSYFSTVKLSRHQVKTIFLSMLAPIVGLAFLALFELNVTEQIEFVVGGKATSAGIGPNQFSSILGAGVVAAFVYFLLEREHWFLRMLMLVIIIWLIGQTALTFSRGGLWTALGSLVAATFFLLRDRQSRGILLAAAVTGFVLIYFVALPALDSYTGGVLGSRVRSLELTGRDRIMEADIIAFQSYPIFGIGPGQSYEFHALTFRASSAHTEYTRMLAEHGSFGLFALLILIFLAVRHSWQARRSPLAQALSVACVSWALLYMVHAAMRLAAPALLFGLAAATMSVDEESSAADGIDDV